MASLRTLVLAGGVGQRLLGMTGGIPKQFYRPDGTRSLVEETLIRVGPLASADRTTVVVGPGQEPFLRGTPLLSRGRVFVQPDDRGTACAVLFGLASALEKDDNEDTAHREEEELDDVVLITPSDHGVARVAVFRHCRDRS